MDYKTSKQFWLDKDLFASQGDRFVNFIIDYICRIILTVAIAVVVMMIALITGNEGIFTYLENMTWAEEYTLGAVAVLLYYNIFEIFFSRTIGKFVTKTIVVDINGEKPHSQEILVRSLCRLIPFEAFSFLGASNKGWHDSISKTYVVKKELLEKKKEQFYALDEIGNTNEL